MKREELSRIVCTIAEGICKLYQAHNEIDEIIQKGDKTHQEIKELSKVSNLFGCIGVISSEIHEKMQKIFEDMQEADEMTKYYAKKTKDN